MANSKSIKLKKLIDGVKVGNLEEIIQFIEQGVEINSRDNLGRTPLSYAVQYQNIAIIQTLLRYGAHPNLADKETSDSSENSPIMRIVNLYVEYNRPQKIREIIQLLTDNGANINQKYCGKTVLMRAASKRDYDLIETLIEIGVDLDVKDNDENSALMIARYEGGAKTFNILKNAGAFSKGLEEIEMILAIKNKDIHQLKQILLDNPRINVNHRINQVTPLCMSIINRDHTVTELLLKIGADVNLRSSEGSLTPLIYAVTGRCISIINLLLNNGADVHAKVEGFKNALEYAEMDKIAKVGGYDEIIAILKSHGAVKQKKSSK
jgi:ankyrin repeat protein